MTANLVVAQLLFLESENPDKDISLYINSPGGSVSAGLSIFDTMNFIKPDVSTLCMGMAASMGAFLLMRRCQGQALRAAQLSKIMIHQPSGGAQGQATDIEIHGARDPQDPRAAQPHPGRTHRASRSSKIASDTERDYFMSAGEAKDYGLIDGCSTSAADASSALFPLTGGRDRWSIMDRTRRLHETYPWPTRKAAPTRRSLLLLLRQEPARGQEAHRRPLGVHLRRVHRAVQRHHPR
jgi:ATP-dependent Clp protease protease subunit